MATSGTEDRDTGSVDHEVAPSVTLSDVYGHLAAEAQAMVEWAAAHGKTPPPSTVEALSSAERVVAERDASEAPGLVPQAGLIRMVTAHRSLARLISPARPDTVAALAREAQLRTRPDPLWRRLYRGLGPLPVIRHLVSATLIFLIAFILFASSAGVRDRTADSTTVPTSATTTTAPPASAPPGSTKPGSQP